MTANRDDRIADLVTARALDPGLSRPDWVSDSEWEEISQLSLIERELRHAAQAPPLERDRVAAMLGLVADPALQLNPAGLKRHRQRARLTPSQVAALLAARAGTSRSATSSDGRTRAAPTFRRRSSKPWPR